jgi:hypothetical protein
MGLRRNLLRIDFHFFIQTNRVGGLSHATMNQELVKIVILMTHIVIQGIFVDPILSVGFKLLVEGHRIRKQIKLRPDVKLLLEIY